MSAAIREGIARLDGWTISLWLQGGGVRVGWTGGHLQPTPAGPMRGRVELDGDPAGFLFHRFGRAPVRIRYDQIVIWRELFPPPRPPLPVEERPRP